MSTKATNPPERPGKKNDQIISYYELRMLIGAAGILLPLLLFFGKLIFNGSSQIEYSISDYYDNGTAGDILVGVLFALGFFLLVLQGIRCYRQQGGQPGLCICAGCGTFSDDQR